jgi:hypothetical protein
MNNESSTKILNTIVKFSPFLLILITVLVFFPTFFNDFQREWDDTWQVLENPLLLNPSFDNFSYHFKDFYEGQYSPVNTLFYIVPYELFGFNAMAFHGTFLMVHIFNVLLVYYIIKYIVKTAKPEFENTRVQLYAFFVALIFAIHPLQVESVAWISASKVVVFTFFMLAAIWCYMQYIRNAKLSWLFAVAILYALSFGSKEQAIILPLNLLALDYINRRFNGTQFRFSIFKKKAFLEKIPFFLMTIGFMSFYSLMGPGNLYREIRYSFIQRMLFGMQSMNEYIFRTIAPVKLFFIYFFPIRIGEELPLFYWGYLVLTLIIMAFVWENYKNNNRLVVFGFLFFIINILLVIHIIPFPRDSMTADRYMYASIIGLALIGIWFLDAVLIKYARYKKQLLVLVAIYVVALGTQSYFRTQEWKNSTTMKKNINELIEKRKALKQPIFKNPLIQAHDE